MPLPELMHIADGHDNVAGLATLDALSGSLFALYKGFVLAHDWKSFQGRALKADRSGMKTWGKPSDTWKMAAVTQDEAQYLADHFGPLVTIRTFDTSAKTWGHYNATMVFLVGDSDFMTWDFGTWRDVKIEFIDLVEIVE
jgi:hypothetical protein